MQSTRSRTASERRFLSFQRLIDEQTALEAQENRIKNQTFIALLYLDMMNLIFWWLKIDISSTWIAELYVDWIWGGWSWASRDIFENNGIPERIWIEKNQLFDNTIVAYKAIEDIMDKIAEEWDTWTDSIGRTIREAYEEYWEYMYVQFC